MNTLLETQLKSAKKAARLLKNMPTCTKNQALDKYENQKHLSPVPIGRHTFDSSLRHPNG